MYSVYADDIRIYQDGSIFQDTVAIDPKLVLEDCSAGSLTITLPPTNAGYSTVERMTTNIYVRKEGTDIWSGRVLSESMDFWNNRVLYCEGAMAFLNDSAQPPHKYSGVTLRTYLTALLNEHNRQVADNRKIELGQVTVYPNPEDQSETFTYYTNYEKTIACLNALIEVYGGHMRIRRDGGINKLDYLADYANTCSQTISFGTNLLEFTKTWDMTEYATAILPLGAKLSKSDIPELDAYVTVKTDDYDSIYVQSDEAVANYGWIVKTVNWDDEKDPAKLLAKAQAYLAEEQFDNMQLELSALDLHYLNPAIDDVNLLDEIRVVSIPHGLDRFFPVVQLEIPLDSPEKTQFKLGDTVRVSLTNINDQTNAYILNKIESLPSKTSILDEAKQNATEIMNSATTGYVSVVQGEHGTEAIYISQTPDYRDSEKLWKFSADGLGYSRDYGETYGLALTRDGAIVADFITAGTLNGDLIRAGVIQDVNNPPNVKLDLDTGKFTMRKGSIYLGQYDGTSNHYKFEVDEDGNMYAKSGTFSGNVTGAKINGGTITGSKIQIGPITRYGQVYGYNFEVDENGVVTALDGRFSGTIEGSTITGTTVNGGIISGGTIKGSKIVWENPYVTGSLDWTSGSTGVEMTYLISMESNRGILIDATGGGMRLHSSKGIWLDQKYNNIWVRNSAGIYIDLGTLIQSFIN